MNCVHRLPALTVHLPPVLTRTGGFRNALLAGCLLWSLGCNSSNPFDQAQVEGSVTYADGTLIPGEFIEVEFHPLVPPKDARTHARPGRAAVDPKTGRFDTVTSYKYGDGIAIGRHKVLVHSLNEDRKPTGAVPAKYQEVEKTPLELDSADSPLTIKVEKPTSVSRAQ